MRVKGLDPEIALDEFPLDFPRQIVGKGLHQHEIAGFRDEGQSVWGSNSKLVLGFVRISYEVIFTLNEMGFVGVEISSGSPVRSAMHSVNVLEGNNAHTLMLFDRDRHIINGLQLIHFQEPPSRRSPRCTAPIPEGGPGT